MRRLHSEKGFSLLEVLVVIAVMGIVAAGTMSMITVQGGESRAFTEKVAANDLMRVCLAT
jgi:prepilin-type N-terminal cleavage/methylation domain-containing protein